MAFRITGEATSDAVRDQHPFAVLLGTMLDQHVTNIGRLNLQRTEPE